MATLTFKYNDGSAQSRALDVLTYWQDWEEEVQEYEDVDWEKGEELFATYKKWHIHFGLLSEADQDFLIAWQRADYSRQVNISSTDYNVIIEKIKIDFDEGYVIVINKSPES